MYLVLVVSIATNERRGGFRLFYEPPRFKLTEITSIQNPANVITCIFIDHSGKNKGPIVGNKKDRPNRLRKNERRSLL